MAQAADIHIIAVPTPITEDKRPDLCYVESATEGIAEVIKPGDLVIVESTVPPATCTKVVGPIIEAKTGLQHGTDYHLAHCPERVIPGKILQEIIKNDRIIGGTTPEATERTATLYARFVEGDLHLTDATTAELCKLMENTYRDVNIALANELAGLAEPLGVDVNRAIELANYHPRVNLHTPGIGVGGHCIPVDPWFIIDVNPEKATLMRAARTVNDARPELFAERLLPNINKAKGKVALLGLSYKANVDDMRESPAIDIVKAVAKKSKKDLWVVEPHADSLPLELAAYSQLSLISAEKAFDEAEKLIVLVEHNVFKKLAKEHKRKLETVLAIAIPEKVLG